MGIVAVAVVAMLGVGIYFVMGPSTAPSTASVGNSASVSAETDADVAAQITEPIAEAAAAESEPEPAVEAEAAVAAEPEAEPVAAVVEEVAAVAPSGEADLTFAVAERSVDCSLLTEAIQMTMETRLGMSVELVEFDSADSLFAALSEGEVDMTLCFVDPEDRSQISGENNGRIGYMRQVGSAIWDSGYGKLQIWGFGAAKSDLRSSHPCALTLLEKFTVIDGNLNAANAEEWLANNAENIANWSTCAS